MAKGDHLADFFIRHLTQVYCAKAHLQERLPEIAEHAHFIDLRHAILETLQDIDRQMIRMNRIFEVLDVEPSLAESDHLIGFIEEAFGSIQRESGQAQLRDLSILFYMQNIESIEKTSFQILRLAAKTMNNKEIAQLLKESEKEAKEDRALFLAITKRQLGGS